MTPFFKVFVDGDASTNLIGTIEQFTYEDSAKESSLLQLTLSPPEGYDLGEDPYLKRGRILFFNFGMSGGSISPTHRAKITDISTRYGATISITVKALDLGNSMRKSSDLKVWKNKNTEEIATEICQGWGLELEIDIPLGGLTKWDSIPQGNKSDFDFINYLLSREKSGNYVFYIRSNRAYIVQRSGDQESKVTYTYKDGSGVVISFEPAEKDSTQTGAGTKSEMLSVNSKGEETKATDDKKSKSGLDFIFDANANDVTNKVKQLEEKIGTPEQRKYVKDKIGKVVNVAVANTDEAENLASSIKTKENANIMTARLTVELDATIEPNMEINMAGVYKPHSGAWRVVKVTHQINSTGTTILELEKASASNKSRGRKATASTDKAVEKTVKINAYDGNANSVQVDKLEYTRKIINQNKR